MKVIGINGSPRKNANTAQLLKHALEGASSIGAETELINLFDFQYHGCISCFACKIKGGKFVGHCAVKEQFPIDCQEAFRIGQRLVSTK